MTKRRVLIIGSQNRNLGSLSFLPEVAQDLFQVMTEPALGDCIAAVGGDSLLLDPSVEAARTAIEAAFRDASNDEATLFLAYVGHGEFSGNDFYLLPLNASLPPKSHTAIHLVQLVKELYGEHSNIDGLVILLDACYSGVAAAGAAARWVGELGGNLRFEVLTASSDRPAADGCFTKNLIKLIRSGISSEPSRYLRCEKIRRELLERCPKQVPQLPSYNADDGLYLAKNVALFSRNLSWIGTDASAAVEQSTSWFQVTPHLIKLMSETNANRCVALVGDAGTGKSALAAALARPEVTEGIVRENFVQAIVFLSSGTSSEQLAIQLSEQLLSSLPDFSAAQGRFMRRVSKAELDELDALQREVVGPLGALAGGREIRIIIDGLDQLSASDAPGILSVLVTMMQDPALEHVRLVVTSRPDSPLPPASRMITMGATEDRHIESYLRRRKLPATARATILKRAKGNWLIARLLADFALADATLDPNALPADLVLIYDMVLARAGATDKERWKAELSPVLTPLAAAGVGPVLPLPILCGASRTLGGPASPAKVRDILVALRGFLVRGSAGTDAERAGAFHQTFVDYLLDPSRTTFEISAHDAHSSLAAAIAEICPMEQHNPKDPLHRYAAANEADHLWFVGEYEQAIDSLLIRKSAIPSENLKRWQGWLERVETQLGPEDGDTFRIRGRIARETSFAGKAREALLLLRGLLQDVERVLGPDHEKALLVRQDIGFVTGSTGDPRGALALLQSLVADQTRILGPDHPDILETRRRIAFETGEAGNAAEAMRLYKEVLNEQESILGPDHPDTLHTRGSIAHWTLYLNGDRAALPLFQELLRDHERALGPDHPDTLFIKRSVAARLSALGDSSEALRLLRQWVSDSERIQGPDHPDTFHARYSVAFETGHAGKSREALDLLQRLLADQTRVLGPEHPDTLHTRQAMANEMGRIGDFRKALRLRRELLKDMERNLGPTHRSTLGVRYGYASDTAAAGNTQEALRLLREVLSDQERILGQDHPTAFQTRSRIALETSRSGQGSEALDLYKQLLSEQHRKLGPDHQDTLSTRLDIAEETALAGQGRKALSLFQELLPDLERTLGRDHATTLATRGQIAHTLRVLRQRKESLRLFEELLPDQLRVLGPDHDETRLTLDEIHSLRSRSKH